MCLSYTFWCPFIRVDLSSVNIFNFSPRLKQLRRYFTLKSNFGDNLSSVIICEKKNTHKKNDRALFLLFSFFNGKAIRLLMLPFQWLDFASISRIHHLHVFSNFIWCMVLKSEIVALWNPSVEAIWSFQLCNSFNLIFSWSITTRDYRVFLFCSSIVGVLCWPTYFIERRCALSTKFNFICISLANVY